MNPDDFADLLLGRAGLEPCNHTTKETSRMSKISNLQAQIDRLTDRVAELQRFGPEPEVGTVLAVTVGYDSIPGSEYEYVLLRAGDGRWYSTGRYRAEQQTWDDVIEWLADPGLSILSAATVTDWADLEGWSDVEASDA